MPGKCSGTGCAACAGSGFFSMSPLADRTPCATGSCMGFGKLVQHSSLRDGVCRQVKTTCFEAVKASTPRPGGTVLGVLPRHRNLRPNPTMTLTLTLDLALTQQP